MRSSFFWSGSCGTGVVPGRGAPPRSEIRPIPAESEVADDNLRPVGLNTLKPAPGSRKTRTRVGCGHGSGTGKTSGRGHKGAGGRSGSKDRPGFEGGQVPIHMRMRKLRGPHMKKSMPFEMFRTHTQAVNLQDLEARFESGDDVTLAAMKAKGLGNRKDVNGGLSRSRGIPRAPGRTIPKAGAAAAYLVPTS